MDARDVCRRLNCSPVTLSEWLDRGCPVRRDPPWANYDINAVRRWLEDNGIRDWPRESDHVLDVPVRALFNALARQEITPWEAEKITLNLGSNGMD
ncbi:MAG: hypothetical protein ACYDCO_02240 [Armatimonadota bacterium]